MHIIQPRVCAHLAPLTPPIPHTALATLPSSTTCKTCCWRRRAPRASLGASSPSPAAPTLGPTCRHPSGQRRRLTASRATRRGLRTARASCAMCCSRGEGIAIAPGAEGTEAWAFAWLKQSGTGQRNHKRFLRAKKAAPLRRIGGASPPISVWRPARSARPPQTRPIFKPRLPGSGSCTSAGRRRACPSSQSRATRA
jgi:hypothetical protein